MGSDSKTGPSLAQAFAERWLARCGMPRAPLEQALGERLSGIDTCPAALWARSGAMALTGLRDGRPAPGPAGIAVAAAGFCAALQTLSNGFRDLDGTRLLGERAALLGLTRAGQIAPGGSARLLEAADGWLAVNLARDEDWASLNAWLESSVVRSQDPSDQTEDVWRSIARVTRSRPVGQLTERGRLLGLPIAPAARADAVRLPPLVVRPLSAPVAHASSPLVIDLSAMWAGPLCSQLLSYTGARIVKVESIARPDGARAGEARFFNLLHAGQETVALDFRSKAGRDALHTLVRRADIVLEASRPRALQQLGIDAEALVRGQPGKIWTSITGYGRSGVGGNWAAFGDDAAVGAGAAWAAADAAGESEPLFCADAVADPLTGLAAATATLAAWQRGGGVLLDVSMAGVVNDALKATPVSPVASTCLEAASPQARIPNQPARPLGADTERVLHELSQC